MAAYRRLAGGIGVTPHWLRKLIGRQPVDVGAHEYLNLKSMYRELCERIEARTEVECIKLLAIEGQINALLQSGSNVDARHDAASPGRTPPSPRPSRSEAEG